MSSITRFLALGTLAGALIFGGCSDDDTSTPIIPNPTDTRAELAGNILGSRTLNADRVYVLKGFVLVQPGAVLTIPAGTRIEGDFPTKGALITVRGSGSQAVIVPQMTMLFVFTAWTFYVLITLAGYALFQALPGRQAAYGRFSDLNLGRVLATIMAIASVGAVLTGWAWMQNLGFVAFAVFWLQGLAILHWLHAAGRLPFFAVVAVYALLPFLNVLLVISLAVVGYMDAWFDFRARARNRDNKV